MHKDTMPYIRSEVGDVPPRSLLIIEAVPIGCATDVKLNTGSLSIQFVQSAAEPPSGLSGTDVNPGELSPADSELHAL